MKIHIEAKINSISTFEGSVRALSATTDIGQHVAITIDDPDPEPIDLDPHSLHARDLRPKITIDFEYE